MNNSRVRELLGWKPRPAKVAAESLIKFDSLN